MSKIGFYILTIAAVCMLPFVLKQAENPKKVLIGYFSFLAIWVVYLFGIVQTGILSDFSLPPKFPLFVVIPMIAFVIFITRRPFFKPIIDTTSTSLPIYLQSFRIIVELLIFQGFLDGVFPQRATFEGLNFDILVGISAPIIGFLVQKEILGRRGIIAWNILSLSILSVTVYSFISTYYFTDFIEKAGNTEFTNFPYIFLAAILVPIAVFLHVVSLKQMFSPKT